MTELQDLCTDLQAIWYQQIPLSKAMDMRIVDFADNTLTCCASLAPNVNVHGTAFAGSSYAVQPERLGHDAFTAAVARA